MPTLLVGTREQVRLEFNRMLDSRTWLPSGSRDDDPHLRLYFAKRRGGCPDAEGFYVMAPKTVEEKVNGPMEEFDLRFTNVVSVPVNADDYFT